MQIFTGVYLNRVCGVAVGIDHATLVQWSVGRALDFSLFTITCALYPIEAKLKTTIFASMFFVLTTSRHRWHGGGPDALLIVDHLLLTADTGTAGASRPPQATGSLLSWSPVQ
jgi:hypothetical protein